MIVCYQGSPGSGKTYDSVNRIVENIKAGRIVYTNIDGLDDSLNREVIKLLTGIDDYEMAKRLIYLSSDKIASFWKYCKDGSFIIIDEIHKWFNSRDWQSQKNREFADWASTHRHHGYDVLMITQDIQKVDSQVRSVVEFTYEYRKLNMFGKLFSNRYIAYAYMGGEVSGRPLGKIVRPYNSKIFSAYKSYITKDTKELGIQTHFNILKHPIFYSIPLVLILFLYFFSKSSIAHGDFLGMGHKTKPVAKLNKTFSNHSGVKRSVVNESGFYEERYNAQGKIVGSPVRIQSKNDVSPVHEFRKPLASRKKVSQTPQPVIRPMFPSGVLSPSSFASSFRLTGLGSGGSGDGSYVVIDGLGIMDIIAFNTRFNKSAVLQNDRLCYDGQCYSLGDKLRLM